MDYCVSTPKKKIIFQSFAQDFFFWKCGDDDKLRKQVESGCEFLIDMKTRKNAMRQKMSILLIKVNCYFIQRRMKEHLNLFVSKTNPSLMKKLLWCHIILQGSSM